MCFVVSLRVPVDVPSSRAAPLRRGPQLWARDYWPITQLSSPVVASPRTTPLFSGSRLQPKSSRATFGCSTTNSGASKTLKYQVAVAVQSTLPRWPTSTRTWHSTSTITLTTRSLTSPFSTPTWLRRVRARWISNRFAVTFLDLSGAGEILRNNLIKPEPCPFLSPSLPPCSIIRPTETKEIAKGVVKFLTDMGLFSGQSPEFFATMNELAEAADKARHGV